MLIIKVLKRELRVLLSRNATRDKDFVCFLICYDKLSFRICLEVSKGFQIEFCSSLVIFRPFQTQAVNIKGTNNTTAK